MAFFDNVFNNHNDSGAPRQSPEIERLNAQIVDEEGRVNFNYYQLGNQYATIHADDYDEEFEQWMKEIKSGKEKIEEMKTQILFLQGIVLCPKCKGENPIHAAFCNACGSPMPKREEPAPDDSPICPKCGNHEKAGMRFCTACGTPLPVQAPAQAPVPPVQPAPVQPAPPVQQPAVKQVKPVMQPEMPETRPVQPPVPPAASPAVEKVCPSCGNRSSDPEDMFCNECGTRLVPAGQQEAEKQPEAKTVRSCANCGFTTDDPEVLFCTDCGTRLK